MTFHNSSENKELPGAVVASGRNKSQNEALTESLTEAPRLPQGEATEQEISMSSDALPVQKWLREFDRITQSRTGGNPQMDDSRDTIYGDRGL